jgi:hypothetical protein
MELNGEPVFLEFPNVVWKKFIIFFDEINTNENINGILKEIVVDRQFMGRDLSSDIIPIAACNPYILKKFDSHTAGLKF